MHGRTQIAFCGDRFVPNDVKMQREGTGHMNGNDGRVMVITGPNMGGKSTYIRTAALCVFLNQIGSFVPAQRVSSRMSCFRKSLSFLRLGWASFDR